MWFSSASLLACTPCKNLRVSSMPMPGFLRAFNGLHSVRDSYELPPCLYGLPTGFFPASTGFLRISPPRVSGFLPSFSGFGSRPL
jgi:hypothetical protein